MSKNNSDLLAVRTTRWGVAEEAKLAKVLRENPIVLDWLVDAQADTVDDYATKPVDFNEPAESVAIMNAYSKGRLAMSLELIGAAQILLKTPDSEGG